MCCNAILFLPFLTGLHRSLHAVTDANTRYTPANTKGRILARRKPMHNKPFLHLEQ
jgi:hypothetical protein